MLFSRLQTLNTIPSFLCLLFLALPVTALADPPVDRKQAAPREILLAELAEDDGVEDVEYSEPRRKAGKVPAPMPNSTPENAAPKPKPVLKPKKVAPNIDLKEIAPAPAPTRAPPAGRYR